MEWFYTISVISPSLWVYENILYLKIKKIKKTASGLDLNLLSHLLGFQLNVNKSQLSDDGDDYDGGGGDDGGGGGAWYMMSVTGLLHLFSLTMNSL